MTEVQDTYQEILDSLPDDELLDFDAFLVGDGSQHLMKPKKSSRTTSQLMGIFTVADLKNDGEEEKVPKVSDLENWSDKFESIEVDVADAFFKEKKSCYQVFDYLKIKSENSTGLIKEVDLVVSDEDQYLLEYLKGKVTLDKYMVTTLAQLSAWKDIGFREVKFYRKCHCALCNAADRSVYDLKELFQRIGTGVFPTHEVCDCDYIPVIRTRNEFVTIPEVEISGKHFTNFPCEFGNVVDDLPIKHDRVEFQDLSKIEGWAGECVVDRGDYLLVHSDYLGNYSPIEFLECWIVEDDELESSDEVLFYRGRQVQLVNGRYIDIATKEVVEI